MPVEQHGPIEERRQPEEHVEEEAGDELREHDLPVAERSREQHLERACGPFFREQPHGQERRNDQIDEPERDVVDDELHRIRDAARPRGGELVDAHDEAVAGDREEDHQDDVRDRRQEVRRQLAANQAQGGSHRFSGRFSTPKGLHPQSPRVARAPWVRIEAARGTLKGFHRRHATNVMQPLRGNIDLPCRPRCAARPWALRCDPFGVKKHLLLQSIAPNRHVALGLAGHSRFVISTNKSSSVGRFARTSRSGQPLWSARR